MPAISSARAVNIATHAQTKCAFIIIRKYVHVCAVDSHSTSGLDFQTLDSCTTCTGKAIRSKILDIFSATYLFQPLADHEI